MENMKRKIAIIVLTVIILTVFITLICCINVNTELKTIKSEKQLEKCIAEETMTVY